MKEYYDDRMYLMHVCKCIIKQADGLETTNLYHENAPDDHHWAVAIFENAGRYKAYDVISFETEDEAKDFFHVNAPMVPRVSLNGEQPYELIGFDEYAKWLSDNNLHEYDYLKVFGLSKRGTNPTESLCRDIQ